MLPFITTQKPLMIIGIAFAILLLAQYGAVSETGTMTAVVDTDYGWAFVSIKNLREKKEKEMGKQNVIEGVDRLQWGKGQENTYIGALTATMRAIGEDVTYDYLMGVSGAAFRLHFQWCPSSPDATCGFDCSTPALKALGYTAYAIHSDNNKSEEVKKVREAVVKSIDKGYPVLAIDLINVPDWGVIIGYSDGGEKFLCRTYYDKSEKYSNAEKWPWVVEIIDQKVDAPEHKESILKSLEIAVKLSNTEKYGDYTSGFAAYEIWAKELLDDAKFANLDEEELKSKNHTNAWCYSSLVDAREAAVRYLKSIGKEFSGESAKHLSTATKLYEEVVGKLKEGWKYSQFPWQLQEGESWTKEMRHSEAIALKEVMTLEKKAITEIEKALAAEGIKISAAEQSGEKKVVLDGVDRYRVIEPMFEGVRVILSHRGEKYSPAYIQGISGAAFRIAGICPCAPTCSSAMTPQELVMLLGYEVESLPLDGEGINPEERIVEVLPRIKDEIRAGRPVILWHAFTNAEWDVVCGFDDEKKEFLGRGSYAGNEGEYATADETRTIKCGHICPPQGAILIGEKTGEFDACKTELAALKEAVKHAHSTKNKDKFGGDEWVFLEGLLAYDRWINDFKNDPNRLRGSGDAYCYGIYKSTHRAASEFLKEIAPKYPETAKHLELAAKHFAAEADVLEQGADLLWWQSPEGPDLERNAKAAELLIKARNSYANGIDEIDKALQAIDASENKLELQVVELSPMKVAYYCYVGENPEGPALDTVIKWASKKNLLVEGKCPRFLGFNNPNPSEGNPVYGFEVWMTVDENVEGDDTVKIKEVPGGLYVVMRATPEEFAAGAWKRFDSNLGPWMKANRYQYDGDRQWLEEHIPNLDKVAEFPELGGDLRWLAFDLCVPIKTVEEQRK
ncbi:effector binding domain-containing protein [bacterium]|nr:effector binding domain-containing protein [bacterium]